VDSIFFLRVWSKNIGAKGAPKMLVKLTKDKILVIYLDPVLYKAKLLLQKLFFALSDIFKM